MTLWAHELRLLLRQRLSAFALVLLALLSVAAIVAGMAEIARQRAAIAAIPAALAEDIGAVADYVDRTRDAGSAAYYSFHPTWDAPSPLAFAALGMRDVSPFILRVRALGLEAQIYDGDTFNPELALPGRFDFAFVLVFLAPLFVIALFHDLVSGEREAGRQRGSAGRLGHNYSRRAASGADRPDRMASTTRCTSNASDAVARKCGSPRVMAATPRSCRRSTRGRIFSLGRASASGAQLPSGRCRSAKDQSRRRMLATPRTVQVLWSSAPVPPTAPASRPGSPPASNRAATWRSLAPGWA